MTNKLQIAAILMATTPGAIAAEPVSVLTNTNSAADSIQHTEWMPEIQVAAAYKGNSLESLRPLSNTTLYMRRMEQWRITDIKELSAVVPNLFIPDYGSRMTSSIYVRGIGSRIDQPSMGVYVDGVPLLNKNCYDFEWMDLRSATVLRGPQNTLYGRNTMGGVIDLKTLSPLDYQGTRVSMEAGNGGLLSGRVSIYRKTAEQDGIALTAYGRHLDGFYKNSATGSLIDWSNSAGLSARYDHSGRNNLRVSNTVTGDWLNQGGYPYRQVETDGTLYDIAYNDRCSYRRWTVRDGLSVERDMANGRLKWISSTAYQWMDDEMNMDQDFTTSPIFTLEQAQQEHSLNEDFVVKSNARPGRHWNHLTGVNVWGRLLHMQAPVLFKEQGINDLILANANANMRPGMALVFEEDELNLASRFRTRSYGAALYHHSSWTLGAWQLDAGLRLDYEGQRFNYNSETTAHLMVTPYMPVYVEFPTELKGKEHQSFTELSPSLAATYRSGAWTWHTSASRGYKAGGYNTQLFSDLLKEEMQTQMMSKMKEMMQSMMGGSSSSGTTGRPTAIAQTRADASGSTQSAATDINDVVSYKPEYSWNYEFGVKYDNRKLRAEATAFYIDCRDQQLTVFPKGVQTGRMMTNAGRTRSYGVEAELGYTGRRGALSASYGWTNATFRQYTSDTVSYRGKHVPYAPEHTVNVAGDWHQPLNGEQSDWVLTLHADWKGVGPIYWDDANEFRQKFYGTLAASVGLQWRRYAVSLWGRNLTDQRAQVFHFVSMEKHFVQMSRPTEYGVKLSAEF